MIEKYSRAHLLIKGNVTGVGYRYWTKVHAQAKSLTGWVKNVNNDMVEAVFEGKKENIQELVNLCRIGPVGSSVKELKIHWQEATKEYHDFSIKR
jgi:acylphosphatase